MIDAGDGITVSMTNASWDELESCEYGSYEDHIGIMKCEDCEGRGWNLVANVTRETCKSCKGNGKCEQRLEPYNEGALHIVELIQRRGKTNSLVLQGTQEIDEFFGAACTGTFGLYKLRVLQRIYKQLLPFVSAERRSHISYGSLGY